MYIFLVNQILDFLQLSYRLQKFQKQTSHELILIDNEIHENQVLQQSCQKVS